MSSCRDHSHHADHDHGHGHGHDHNHDDDVEAALKESLLSKIDLENVRCLNEAVPGSVKHVFKPWELRMDLEKFVESDSDEQLIIFVPFTGMVKLKSITLRGGVEGASPSLLKVFINREDIDFDSAESTTPTQEWELVDHPHDVVEYSTRLTKFNSVRNLTLYFPSNFGSDTSILSFIAFKGEWSEVKQDPIITIYEVQPNVKDHKVPGIGESSHQQIG
ncbi:hypothetical protein DSO57_1015259 [Entomophthora muscae]|uniref:Uncharacterized protein n=1 Tax=Entomophthora muscae TaxID=34485 RepID=A0ACC2T579_9FUNG|nr:hypothetical protein DSO57_1015259 [Entomophthora muscae]